MSLATTCPACGTCFRVVQDQLKVSEGWVRCGHCQDVFNAMEGLFELEVTPSRAAPEPAAPDPPAPPVLPALVDPPEAAGATTATAGWTATAAEPAEPATPDAAPAALAPPPEPAAPETAAPPDVAPSAPAAPAGDAPGHGDEAAPPPIDAGPPAPTACAADAEAVDADADIDAGPAQAAHDDGAGAADPAEAEVMDGAAEALEAPAAAEEPAASAAAPLPEFVRLAQRRARWDNPWVRAWLAAAAVISGLLLVGQAAYHWRDRLAAGSDWARAVLAPACQTFGCTLQPPQVLDALVVDNTALNRPGDAGAYELAVTLRNRANHPVAAPLLELTLSDGQGSTLSRRVLRPQDFQADPGVAIPAQSDVTWTVRFSAASLRVAGYTVAAFYP